MRSLVPTHSNDSTLPDSAVAARARSGAPDALARLFERYGEMAYRVAFRLTGSAADAEDVLQDVFVGLPEALRGFEGRGSLEGWLKRVVVRTTLMRLRGERRRREAPLGGGDQGEDAAPPASRRDDPGRVIDALTIADALAELPEPLRQVFVLREIEGYSHEEIGGLLGIRRGTSEVRFFRARQALRERLRGSR